jgi:flagellar protein FlaI
MPYDFFDFEKRKKKKGTDIAGILGGEKPKKELDLRAQSRIKDERTIGGLLGMAKEEAGSYLESFDKIRRLGEEVVGEVLEEAKDHRIVKKPGEKLPIYVVFLPELDEEDKKILKEVERRAVAEITIDPESFLDREKKREAFLKEVLALMDLRYPEIPKHKQRAFAELIVQNMIGYGLLEPLLNDDSLEEVMVVGTRKHVYVYHRRHGMCKTNIVFESDSEIEKIINRIARSIGRRVDLTSPLLDARLSDGSRVNATIPPVSLDGPSLTIRKFRKDPLTVVDIINFGTLTTELAAFLWLVAEGYGVKPANFLVSGGTGSGKTTTLNCLGSFIPPTDRVISIEDTAELQLPIEHWIRLETRPPNVEGKGEINMEMLLKNTLRMRPDRIIVGEVRGAEAKTLLAAMNTGQNGCLGTLHANTARETITRLTSAPMNVPKIMIPSLDFIFMQNRFSYKGKTVRRITEIAEVVGIEDGEVKLNIIYEWDPRDDTIKPTGVPCVLKGRIAELRGISLEQVDAEIERRKRVLDYMVENNLRSIAEVGRMIREYYVNPERLLQEISGIKKSEEKKPRRRRTYLLLGEEDEEEAEEVVLEENAHRRIVRVENEKNPRYLVPLPKLSSREKQLLEDIENRAVKEINIDPESIPDREERKRVFMQRVLEVIERFFPEVRLAKRKDMAKLVVNNMVGYSLLEFLLSDDHLEEIMVIGTKKPVYVNHRDYGNCKTNLIFDTDEEITRIIEKIATSVGRRIDKSSPLLDARLPDGSRVNATIPPISLDGPTLTIRKFRSQPLTVVNLIEFRTLNVEVAAYLWLVVEGLGIKPGNVLAAGGAGSGKTTTLNVLCSFIPETERVITIEDTAELTLPVEHVVRLETRPPNVEGEGEVTMDDLVKNTLRMRPDRIIVGEVRGREARTLFTAMNTGHDGCMGTVHANSAKETLIRLTNPPMEVPEIMLPALDLILMQNKIYHENKTLRRITEVAEVVSDEHGRVSLNNVYEWDPRRDDLVATGVPSILKQKLARLKGISAKELEEELRRREKVLSWMVENHITDIRDVSKTFNRYYSDPEGFIHELELHGGGRVR